MQNEAGQNIVERYIKPLFTRTINYAEASPKDYVAPLTSYQIDQRASVNDADLDELSHILFGETSNRPEEKQDLERRVITNTALNRMAEFAKKGKKMSLTDVLRQPNQYQAYLPEGIKGKKGEVIESQYQKSKSGNLDEAGRKKLESIRAFVKSLKAGKFDDNTDGAFYYVHNPDGSITYDDTRPLFSK